MSLAKKLFAGTSQEGVRATWTPEATVFFLDLLVEHKSLGNWQSKSPNKKAYENIIAQFESGGVVFYTRKQLKNKFDSLKETFGLWVKMFNGQTGGGYDAANGNLVMEPEWWDAKISVDKRYGRFRENGLVNADAMYAIYGDGSATGANQFTPTAANPQYRQQTPPPRARRQGHSQPSSESDNEFEAPIDEVNSSRRVPIGRSRFQPRQEEVVQKNPLDYTITINEGTVNDTTPEAIAILQEMRPLIHDKLYKRGLMHITDKAFRSVFISVGDFDDRVFLLESKAPNFSL